MNKRDLEPLPTEVGAMLDTLKPIDAVPIEVRTRLRSRVLVSVGAGGGPSGATATPGSAPVSKSAGWWLAAGVGVGLSIGLAVFLIATSGERQDEVAEPVIAPPEVGPHDAESAGREESVERPEAPLVRLAPVHEEVPRTQETVAPTRVREPAVDREAAPPAASVAETETERETVPETAASDRAEQRAIVERARSALAAGRTADATSALDEHDRRFVGGPYAEEAAALRVRVLLASGRRDEARETAQRFLERYPNSIFRDVLGPALRE